MAAAAVRAEFTIMDVIGPMTIAACTACLLHRCQRAAVAIIAGDVDMRAIYCETRLSIMIKKPQVPGDWVMTGLTVILEPAVVRIIIEMAIDALLAGIGKHLGFMAGLTLDIAMFSQ